MERARPTPSRFVLRGARGVRFGPVPDEIESGLDRWLATGRIDEGTAMKRGRVACVGGFVVKILPRRRGPARFLRRSKALRAAALHHRLPIRTPRPLLAVGPRPAGASIEGILVYEYVEGRPLRDAWPDESARDAFPRFLAEMHRAGVWHGDLHAGNLLWDGEEWVLLDLDGVRHLLHRVAWRRHVVNQWARLLVGLSGDARVRDAFERYHELFRAGARADRVWARIQRRAERLRAARA